MFKHVVNCIHLIFYQTAIINNFLQKIKTTPPQSFDCSIFILRIHVKNKNKPQLNNFKHQHNQVYGFTKKILNLIKFYFKELDFRRKIFSEMYLNYGLKILINKFFFFEIVSNCNSRNYFLQIYAFKKTFNCILVTVYCNTC